MVARLSNLLLLCGLCLLVVPAWALSFVPPMETAAQDAAGTVWAVPQANQGNDTEGTAYFWRRGTWVAQAIPGAVGFRQRAMTRGDDGSVYVFWQKWDAGQYQTLPQCLVTVHRGVGSRLFARFTDPFALDKSYFPPSTRSLWVGAGGDIWIADGRCNLRHIAADGTVHTFPVDPKQYFNGTIMGGLPTQPLSSFTDSQGRRWFWQVVQNYWDSNALRGVLIWDGKALAHHPMLPGLPDRPFSFVTPQNARYLWVAQTENGYPWVPKPRGGLYRIDTQTLSAVLVAPPSKEAFQSIARIIRINGDWCILTVSQKNHWHLDLWHQRGTVWSKEPQALADSLYGWQDMLPKAALETPLGTWLGVNGAGLYWLPKDGRPAVRVDWRRGLPVGRVNALFRLPNGNILAFVIGESAEISSVPPPLYPARLDVRVGTEATPINMADLISDQRRHLWGLEYIDDKHSALDEWDGTIWHKYSVPKTIPGVNGLYTHDTLGRIWLTTNNWNPPAQPQPIEGRAVYDPAHRTWTKYDTVSDAVQSAASVPGMAFLPHRNTSQLPAFSGNGQAAFISEYKLFFFDGHVWQHWSTRELKPNPNDINFEATPQFDSRGHLKIVMDNQEWGWTPEGGWQLDGPAEPPSTAPALPPGGPKGFWGTPLTDNCGAQWVNWDSNIYLIRHGLWRKQSTLSGPGSPFWDGRGLNDVMQDSDGHHFFQTTAGGQYEYVVWSPPVTVLPPAPRIQITSLGADAVRLRFFVKMHRAHWFQWRLTGGVWSAPQTADSVTLTALLPGNYRVEAQAVDTLLQASPKPSAAVFVIQAASPAQIARWVQTLLSGPDDAREAAVAGLVKQPSEALPALQSARPGASENGRWWLDAAIQQITDASLTNQTPGSD